MANENTYLLASDSETGMLDSTLGYIQGLATTGKSNAGNVRDGAFRFNSVAISQGVTINEANLYYYVAEKGTSSERVYVNCYGIDQDDTANFSSDPFSRPKTSAVTTFDTEMPSVGTYQKIVVTSQVNEIVARAGWSSGNDMGFLVEDNGSQTGTFFSDTDGDSYLSVRVSAAPNFNPTPGTVTTGTAPAATDYGIKVSEPGVDVGTASETELIFTTRKRLYKVIAQGEISATANVTYTIAHGLSYKPQAVAFASGGGYRFKLPRLFPSASDPVGGGIEGNISVGTTNVEIVVTKNASIYYYIFIDQLAS